MMLSNSKNGRAFIGLNIVILLIFLGMYLYSVNEKGNEAVLENTHKTKVNGKSKYAFVTLATTDTTVKGVVALTFSMTQVKSKYPFVVLVSDQVSKENLVRMKHPSLNIQDIRKIEKIVIPPQVKIGIEAWKEALNKIRIWELEDYEKLIFMDADQIVRKNIDHWFELPTLSGNVNHDLECVDDGTRTQGRGGLNAGLFVFEPNKTIYNEMLALLNNGQSWGNSDQGLIETYFNDRHKLHLIPSPQTTFARCCHASWFNRTLLRVVHFTHFALDFEKVSRETIDHPHLKNWNGIPNCDVDFYKEWKYNYHAGRLVSQEKIVNTEVGDVNLYVSVLGIGAIALIAFVAYKIFNPNRQLIIQ